MRWNLVDQGPVRVVAGPGTGKTTTVVAIYLRLLEERGLRPSQVLLLTFANNAADGPQASHRRAAQRLV